jgi:hypothetical protein
LLCVSDAIIKGVEQCVGTLGQSTTRRTRAVADKLSSQNAVSALEVMALTMRAIWDKAVNATF